MKTLRKRFQMTLILAAVLILVLAVVLTLLLTQGASSDSAEPTAQEKAMAFLTDVVGLDMTKYNVTKVEHMVPNMTQLNQLGFDPTILAVMDEESVTFTLESAGNNLRALCKLRNNAISWCSLSPIMGAMIFTQSTTDPLESVNNLLQRYQTYSGASYLQEMRNMLANITEFRTVTTTHEGIKLEIYKNEPFTYVSWIQTVNGVDINRNKVYFRFHNGIFDLFSNSWNLYKVGSTDVKVSKEEAIRIARERAQNFSWRIYKGNDAWVEVTEFNILEEPVTAEFAMVAREPLTLYPFWSVRLYFDKLIYSNNGIAVGIWADTAQIDYIDVTGIGGNPAGDADTSTTTPLPDDSANPTTTSPDGATDQTSTDLTPIIIAAPTAIATVTLRSRLQTKKEKPQPNITSPFFHNP